MSDRLRKISVIGIVTLLPLLMLPTASAQQSVIASDNFNRANESPLAVGGNWARYTPGGFADLSGNEVAGVSADALYYWQGAGTFLPTEQFARAKVTNAGGQAGLVLLGASDHALVTAWGGGTLYVYWYLTGFYQGNLTTMPSTLQNGDVVEARLEGGIVSVKINGTVVLTVPNTTTLTSGTPGFETFLSGAKLDDWEGGTHTTSTCGEDGSECDDGNACTKGDKCQAGTCVGGPPVVCLPPDLCHDPGVCDPTSGLCSSHEISCDDDNECTADSCDPATGCVHTGSGNNCDDGNPCTVDTCSPGGCVHTGIDGPDNSCSKVTNSSLCALPTGLCGDSRTAPQFRLLDLQDPTFSSILRRTVLNDYIINASNPGQFYYNVFRAGAPGAALDFTIEVPFPFVTQGAHPIQFHDGAAAAGDCYVPGPSLDGFTVTTDGGGVSPAGFPIIRRSDYDPQNIGGSTTVRITGHVPASGILYVTIHLDYGLKKVTGWQLALDGKTLLGPDTNLDGALDGFGDGSVSIGSPQPYGFSFEGTGGTHTFSPSSCNKIKKQVGVNGNTLKAVTGEPVSNVRVQLFGPTGSLVATATSDQDGFYSISYKHKGRTANYTVRAPDYGKQQTITLKASGYARVNFEDLLIAAPAN